MCAFERLPSNLWATSVSNSGTGECCPFLVRISRRQLTCPHFSLFHRYCFACDLTVHAQAAKKKHIRQAVATLADAKTGAPKEQDANDEFLSCEPDLAGKPFLQLTVFL